MGIKKIGYVGVKYIRSLSENVVKVFNNHHIEVNVAHTTGNNLHPIYNTHKEKYDKRKLKNTVYKIKCMGNKMGKCNVICRNHFKKYGNRDQCKSMLGTSHTALAEHAIIHNHRFDTEKPKALCIEKRWDRRMILESFNIFTTKNSINF